MSEYELPSPEVAARIAELSERRLSREEFERLLAMPWVEGEKEDLLDHIAWFTRRYPTPLDRLRWAANRYRQWTRHYRP